MSNACHQSSRNEGTHNLLDQPLQKRHFIGMIFTYIILNQQQANRFP
jgi:hypothetical protein